MILQIHPHHLIILLLMLLQWATVNFKKLKKHYNKKIVLIYFKELSKLLKNKRSSMKKLRIPNSNKN